MFPEHQIFAPNLSHENLATDTGRLIRFVSKEQIDLVIGTSLGGLIADYVGAIASTDTLLINPLVEYEFLAKQAGETVLNYKTGEQTVFDPQADVILQILTGADLLLTSRKLSVALGVNDKVLNHQAAISKYGDQGATIDCYDDDHRFNKFFEEAVKKALLTSSSPQES
jgi:predicted esterase YcpF (UPF0227 family)